MPVVPYNRTLRQNYQEKLASTFLSLSWEEQQQFIGKCHAVIMELEEADNKIAGRFWGLQGMLERDQSLLDSGQKEKLEREWRQFLEMGDEQREVRGVCRQAHRISEQIHLSRYEKMLSQNPGYDEYLEARAACAGFKF